MIPPNVGAMSNESVVIPVAVSKAYARVVAVHPPLAAVNEILDALVAVDRGTFDAATSPVPHIATHWPRLGEILNKWYSRRDEKWSLATVVHGFRCMHLALDGIRRHQPDMDKDAKSAAELYNAVGGRKQPTKKRKRMRSDSLETQPGKRPSVQEGEKVEEQAKKVEMHRKAVDDINKQFRTMG